METTNVDGEIGIVMLRGCRCRCGHEWLARDPHEKPRVCPKCKSPYWDRPKQFERNVRPTKKK
jgi:predicted Zn-ribbon and HTH transcriptional regulator